MSGAKSQRGEKMKAFTWIMVILSIVAFVVNGYIFLVTGKLFYVALGLVILLFALSSIWRHKILVENRPGRGTTD